MMKEERAKTTHTMWLKRLIPVVGIWQQPFLAVAARAGGEAANNGV